MRLWFFHGIDDPEEHPGYTMHALSRAVYARLRAAGSDSFQVMALESVAGTEGLAALGLAGNRTTPVRWRGTLSLGTPRPVPFPLLVNGHRVEVPALHLRGRFTARGRQWEPQLWVLADSSYPLLLKWVGAHGATGNVLQTVRLDSPSHQPGSVERDLERGLASTCRVELPGIYFAFNSAALDSASNRTLASVAEILRRHGDWRVTLEGHTDSIGTAAANQVLSERRVEAVRTRLVNPHRVEGARLRAVGLGSSRPRESNATIEGRARNRRVELVRDCAG
jgi:outer membrane protein OmpA-like peptidoglycan-associated protein